MMWFVWGVNLVLVPDSWEWILYEGFLFLGIVGYLLENLQATLLHHMLIHSYTCESRNIWSSLKRHKDEDLQKGQAVKNQRV